LENKDLQLGGEKMLLEVSDISARYVKRPVIEDLSFTIKEKEKIAIIGHNGAGKTTLLRSIFGLHQVSKGEIVFSGTKIVNNSTAKNVSMGMAFVAQGHNVFAPLTVQENLKLGLYQMTHMTKAERQERLDAVNNLFPILKDRSKQLAGTMSGGQQQMLAIGIALMAKPKLLMLDEPSTGLSPLLVQKVLESVEKVHEELGTSIILVEQNVKEALRVTDRAIVIKQGRIIYEGPSKELLDRDTLWDLF
jgi:branched-chain amino acid transport system ATP-binding protein